MKQKKSIILTISILIVVGIIVISIWYFSKDTEILPTNNNTQIENNSTNQTSNDLPTTGNNAILKTNSNTILRFINDYSTDFFTTDKNLLIMFGSWCAHCQEELADIEKILNYYQNDKDVNIILIAHEYEETVSNLIQLVEKDFNFGNIEILVDFKRVIRKNVDPEANTVPISYVVDKNGNIIKKHNSAINLDTAKDMLK